MCARILERTAEKDAARRRPGSLSPVQQPAEVPRAAAALALQLGEYPREEVRVGVDAQHLAAGGVDDGEAAVPEGLLARLHQEGLERVGDRSDICEL